MKTDCADVHDDADWSETDLADLRAALAHGDSIEQAAGMLCRAGSVDDVAAKASELGLKPKAKWCRDGKTWH